MLTLLAAAAVLAGITGAWSPCGFSMVETLAPHGYAGRRGVTLAACLTFTAGALAGGVATFGGLALLGEALGAGGAAAAGVAAAVALAAAIGEARGTRIAPQIRRQVPESWRRVLPVPLAAGLYGVLLGLGFTTFILTFAVWALAASSIALGEPAAGLAIGLGFGIGRALPVVVLAPLADTDAGSRAHAAMAERPGILRALRGVDAAALLACAAALVAGPALAADVDLISRAGTDPSAAGDVLVYHQPGRAGVLVRDRQTQPLPGRFPAVGGGNVAWVEGDVVAVARADTLQRVTRVEAPGADAVAVSAAWVAWRAGDRLLARAVAGGKEIAVDTGGVGRPALDGARLVYHQTTRQGSKLHALDLAKGVRTVLGSARRALLLNPTTRDGALLYVRSTRSRQELRLRTGGTERVVYSLAPTGRRDVGRETGRRPHRHRGRVPRQPPRPLAGVTETLWTTALGDGVAYVTRLRALRGTRPSATLLRIRR